MSSFQKFLQQLLHGEAGPPTLPPAGNHPAPATRCATPLQDLPRDIARDWLQGWGRGAGINVQTLLPLAQAWTLVPPSKHPLRDALQRLRALQAAMRRAGVAPNARKLASRFAGELLLRAGLAEPQLLRGRRWPAVLKAWGLMPPLDAAGRPTLRLPALNTEWPDWGLYPRMTVEQGRWRMPCGHCDQRCGIDNMLLCATCANWLCFRCSPERPYLPAPPDDADYKQRVLQCKCGAALRSIDDWLAADGLISDSPPKPPPAPELQLQLRRRKAGPVIEPARDTIRDRLQQCPSATVLLERLQQACPGVSLSECELGWALRLTSRPEDAHLISLAALPEVHWIGLLSLRYCQLDDAKLALLLRSSFIDKLWTLDLGHNALTDSSIALLRRQPLLRKLRELYLDGNLSISQPALATLHRHSEGNWLESLNEVRPQAQRDSKFSQGRQDPAGSAP